MIKHLLLLSLLSTTIASYAQNTALGCGNGRYVNNVFPAYTKTSNITYGVNTVTDYSTNTSTPVTLKMDFYEPLGDVAVKRPLVILLFGGGFITGQRTDMEPLAIALALKGYTAATIDYRLINPNPANVFMVASSPALLTDEVIKAIADLKASIRYVKHNAATTNTFKVDTTKIFVGGGSAGAITALHAAYTDDINENPAATAQYNTNGGFEGNTDLPAPNNLLPMHNANGIAGVLNIAGGIYDTSLIDSFNPPVYSAQGTNDEVVPYNYGTLSMNGQPLPMTLYGSNLITTRANNLMLKHNLYPIQGGDHASPNTEPHISNIVAGVSVFMESITCSTTLPVTLSSFVMLQKNCAATLNWQTASEMQSSHFEVEQSGDGVKFEKIAIVKSKNVLVGAAYTYKVEGTPTQSWFRLKMVDKDGSFTYSPVQKFKADCAAQIKVFPNPAISIATISGLEARMQVDVINAEGKLLWTAKATGNALQIPVASLTKGLLLVQVKDAYGKVISSNKLVTH